MRALAFVFGLLFGFALAGDAGAKDASFSFQVPAGWKARDTDSVTSDMTGARDAGVLTSKGSAMARAAHHAAAAVNPASDPGFVENMNAVVEDGARPVTLRRVHQAADGVVAAVQTGMGNTGVTIVESRIVSIRGVDCGNVTYDYTMRGVPVRSTLYLLPGDEHTAIVTFAARHDDFERHRVLYEATIAATEGIVRPPGASYWRRLAAIVAAAIILTLITNRLARRAAKRKAAAS